MRGFMFQDWVTINGTSTTTSIIQSDEAYLDLAAFEDYVAWVEVDSFTAGGASTPTLYLETAPLKEDALFAAAASGWRQTSVAVATGVSTVKNVLNASVPPLKQIPLARWLRWRLDMTGASSTWSVTFRIHLAAHSVCLPDGAG